MISNHITLIGRLTRDIELRKTQSDKTVTSFSVAVNRPYNKENNHPEADFFNCVAWEKTAEFISKYFKKGDKIAIAGRLQTGEYEKDGTKVRTVDIVVEEVEFVERRSDSAPKADAPTVKPTKQAVVDDSDDLPFN